MMRAIPTPRLAFVLLCLALGLFVMLPEFLAGTSYSYSFRYNIVWGSQIVEQMRGGEVYPRWLSGSWDGLGAPTFYFYAPTYFLTAGAIGALTGELLSLSATLALASAVFIGLSGIAMQRWLARIVSPRIAVGGALAYMLAPYHLHEVYSRGALAEASIYLALPLVLLALHDLKAAKPFAIPMLAACFGLLTLSHLPVALLGAATLFPAYGLFLARESEEGAIRFIVKATTGVILGTGLAAIFLLPALGLLPHISADQLRGPAYAPESSFFFSGAGSVFGGNVADNQLVTVFLSAGYLFASILVLATRQREFAARLFAGVGVACFLIVSGLLPFFWDVHLFRQVQFPARILPVMEIAVITAMALAWPTLSIGRLALTLLPALFGSVIALNMAMFRVGMAAEQGKDATSIVLSDLRDAPEYLPHGHPVGLDDKGRADPSAVRLPPANLAVTDKAEAKITQVSRFGQNGLAISIVTPVEARLSVRRFHFPHWRVEELGQETVFLPDADALKRVSWRVPPGAHHYRLFAATAPYEALGHWLSLGSLFIIAGWLLLARRGRT